MAEHEGARDELGRADTITDAIPASIFDAVTRYHDRHGYRLRRFTLIGAETYEATFEKQEGSR